MWIMMITFLLYADPEIGAMFSPTVTSVQFSSEERCKAAREEYLKDLNPVREAIERTLGEKEKAGELNGPNGVIISALCVPG
jgi:hypothetical protein